MAAPGSPVPAFAKALSEAVDPAFEEILEAIDRSAAES